MSWNAGYPSNSRDFFMLLSSDENIKNFIEFAKKRGLGFRTFLRRLKDIEVDSLVQNSEEHEMLSWKEDWRLRSEAEDRLLDIKKEFEGAYRIKQKGIIGEVLDILNDSTDEDTLRRVNDMISPEKKPSLYRERGGKKTIIRKKKTEIRSSLEDGVEYKIFTAIKGMEGVEWLKQIFNVDTKQVTNYRINNLDGDKIIKYFDLYKGTRIGQVRIAPLNIRNSHLNNINRTTGKTSFLHPIIKEIIKSRDGHVSLIRGWYSDIENKYGVVLTDELGNFINESWKEREMNNDYFDDLPQAEQEFKSALRQSVLNGKYQKVFEDYKKGRQTKRNEHINLKISDMREFLATLNKEDDTFREYLLERVKGVNETNVDDKVAQFFINIEISGVGRANKERKLKEATTELKEAITEAEKKEAKKKLARATEDAKGISGESEGFSQRVRDTLWDDITGEVDVELVEDFDDYFLDQRPSFALGSGRGEDKREEFEVDENITNPISLALAPIVYYYFLKNIDIVDEMKIKKGETLHSRGDVGFISLIKILRYIQTYPPVTYTIKEALSAIAHVFKEHEGKGRSNVVRKNNSVFTPVINSLAEVLEQAIEEIREKVTSMVVDQIEEIINPSNQNEIMARFTFQPFRFLMRDGFITVGGKTNE